MKIDLDLKIEDWVEFQEFYRKKKTPMYRYIWPLLLGCAFLLIPLTCLHLYYQGFSIITMVSFVLFVILLYLIYLRQRYKKQLLKTAWEIQQKNPEAFGKRIMTFNETGIDILAGKSHKFLYWNEMSSLEENQDYFFLISRKGMVYILPKRDLGENLSGFETLVAEYFPQE